MSDEPAVRTTASEGTWGHPDWVLLGVPYGDGVSVFGSLELSLAELRMERDEHEVFSDSILRRFVPGKPRFFITAQMKTYAWATGKTYAEALSALFAHWDADGQRQPLALNATKSGDR